MKKTILFISTLIFCICLSSCAALCNHTWNNATCTNAKTCTNCHSTEGEPLGHIWNNATCTTPKTCSICSTTEGSPIGHVWNDATCTTPRSCNICGITEGNTISHIWRDATCTEPFTCISCNRTAGSPLGHTWDGKQSCTQANKCTICGITDGNIPGHKWSEATCTKAKTCSICGITDGNVSGHKWREATYNAPETCYICGTTRGEPLIPGVALGGTSVEINSVGGAKPRIFWRNDSGKIIKYITFTAVPYNAVGDIVSSSIGNTTYANLKITGPIEPTTWKTRDADNYIDGNIIYMSGLNDNGSRYYYVFHQFQPIQIPESEHRKLFFCAYFDPIWYNGTIRKIVITKINVEYMDGTTETIVNPKNKFLEFYGLE